METKILIAGFGGQGVLSMGKMICEAAVQQGRNATFFPSYGGEQRGGTCNCMVVIKNKSNGSPIVTKGNYVIIMNNPSYEKFKDNVLPGGILLLNTSQVQRELSKGSELLGIEADRLAEQAGGRIAANMVMLGAFTNVSKFASQQEMEQMLRTALSKKPQYLQTNLTAFHLGIESVSHG